jgi:hypothetical protein
VLANRDQAAQRVRDIVCWADSTALVPQQLRQLEGENVFGLFAAVAAAALQLAFWPK